MKEKAVVSTASIERTVRKEGYKYEGKRSGWGTKRALNPYTVVLSTTLQVIPLCRELGGEY